MTRTVIVVPGKSVTVYEDRKPIAFLETDYPFDAEEIEELRVTNYLLTLETADDAT